MDMWAPHLRRHVFDGRFRISVDKKTAPVGVWLNRHGVTADVLTVAGLISAGGAAFAIGIGNFPLAIALLVLTGLGDLLDGPVARAGATTSSRGAFLDSTIDRVVDLLLMAGVAWYLLNQHETYLVMLPIAIAGVTSLISYQRAEAESLGLEARGGLMERGERMVLLGIALLSPAGLVPVLWVFLVLTVLTALGRFAKVWKEASRAVPPKVRRPRSADFEVGRRPRSVHRPVETLTTRWKARFS